MAEALAQVATPRSATAELEARFRDFVVAHHERAVRIAWRLTGGDPAAEDLAQEAFLEAYRGLRRFRGESELTTWYYRILVRQVYRHRRRSARQHAWLRERDLASPLTSPDEDPPEPGLRARLAGALEGLPRGQREVFVLVHLEGFTIGETAGLLRKSPGTVKSHLSRALRGLREQLEDFRPSNRGEKR